MIVYDITDRESFDNIKMWMGEIEKYFVFHKDNSFRYAQDNV